MVLLGNYIVAAECLTMLLTVATTYTISVARGDVYPFMPLVSYTGDLPYESCIFSFGFNLVGWMFIITASLR